MKTIKGPAIFLAQFMADEAPFNSLDGVCKWALDFDSWRVFFITFVN